MAISSSTERVLNAPETLGLDTRAPFRQEAVTLLDELPEGLRRLVLDLDRTNRVDSAGLGALMLVHHRAAEPRQIVALRNSSDKTRFLLACTTPSDSLEVAG